MVAGVPWYAVLDETLKVEGWVSGEFLVGLVNP
jgi:hypothetical protein